MKRFLWITGIVFVWLFAVTLFLFVSVVVLFQIPAVQNYAAQKAVSSLSDMWDTKVEINSISLTFSGRVRVNGLYIEDQQEDTLWSSKSIFVRFSPDALLRRHIRISDLEANQVHANIERSAPEYTYNFDFITGAGEPDEIDDNIDVDPGKTAWRFTVKRIALNNISFAYNDERDGTKLNSYIGRLRLVLNQSDFSSLAFDIKNLDLRDSYAEIKSYIPGAEFTKTESETSLPTIHSGPVTLNNIDFRNIDFRSGTGMKMALSKAYIKPSETDLTNSIFRLEEITLNQPLFAYSSWETPGFAHETYMPDSDTYENGHQAGESVPFTLDAKVLKLNNGRFTLDDYNSDKAPEGTMDFSNLDFYDLNFDASEVLWEWTDAKAVIHNLSGKERSGFKLDKLRANLLMSDQYTRFEHLTLRTPNSRLQDHLTISYPGLRAFVDNYMALDYSLSLKNSYIDFSDVFYFAPFLREEPAVAHLENKRLNLNGKAGGTIDALEFDNFRLNAGLSTDILLNGSISGLPETDEMFIDISAFDFHSVRSDINYLIPPEYRTNAIEFPAWFNVRGGYTGTMEQFRTNFSLNSSMGMANGNFNIRFDQDPAESTYKGNLSAHNLNIGRLSKYEDVLGKGTFRIVFDGKGMDVETMDAAVNGRVTAMEVMGYNYQRLELDGNIRHQYFDGNADLDDPNLSFNLAGTASFEDDYPLADLKLELRRAHLKPLQLADDEQKLSGLVEASIEGDHIDNLHGTVNLRDFEFETPNLYYPLNRADFRAETRSEEKIYTLDADFIQAGFFGNITLSSLPAALQAHLNEYFEIPGIEEYETTVDQSFEFNLNISETLLITEFFIPELEAEAPISVQGNYESNQMALEMEGSMPYIEYAGNVIDTLLFQVNSTRQKLDYNFYTHSYKYDIFMVPRLTLSGTFEDNMVTTGISVEDENNTPRYTFGASMQIKDTLYKVRLLPGELTLNYDTWHVPEENAVWVGSSSIWVDNLLLTGERGQLSIQSGMENDRFTDNIDIRAEDFSLTHILHLLQVEEETAQGRIAVNAALNDPLNQIDFNADISLTDVLFQGYEAGAFHAKASKSVDEEPYNFELNYVSSRESSGHLAGSFTPDDSAGYWDVNLQTDQIYLSDFQGLLLPHVTRLQGRVAADVDFRGSHEDPIFDGFVEFIETGFSTPYSGNYFSMPSERITFDRDRLQMDNFSVHDSLGNPLNVRGAVAISDIQDPVFELAFNTRNFLLFHTGRQHNPYFYGTAFIDTDMQLTGSIWEPEIEGNLNFRDNTDLYAELTDYEPDAVGYEDVVRFDNWKRADDQPVIIEEQEAVTTFFRGLEADILLNIDRATRLTVVVDPDAGDFLRLTGGGTINAGIDRAGSLTLSGRYDIDEGSYQMTFYDVVRRRFEIRPGSNIIWTGDPMEAQMDISAIYTQRTSPAGLFPEHGSSVPTAYRQPVPFQVYLNMAGNMIEPEVSFLLDMPQEHRGAGGGVVYSRIQQINENESERNKQVFALLVLNRFLPENPFEGPGAGAGIAGGARSSASRIITQQLNQISDRYIRGVDISFDVESYEGGFEGGTNGRTELQMEVSRRFMDERMEVRIGGHVDLEGEQRRETGLSDFAGDVSLEYRLTEDGRLRLKGFRQRQYENIIDGEYTETGVSLRFGRDFQSFRELFRRRTINGTPVEGENGEKPSENEHPESNELDEM